ncbi:carnitine O-acetyltransferase, mitochondrial precursor [Lodderomyces elongisporus NRRL YB-4239]|uniref:Carnitine O-acetyltransferase, mitochondrial n=1 Tax=Lodderomyces elongisporus (strain ATCC 11503 / CBS 2605 / JCM 1781 / NBRC 1676 / NRRL YB-4239) TaxID=379508 RepID=A5E413_LODEL|nr:carnitine O-acetyltransferase, mitochondrial precursor [Lodderomyces elongisporus NRRL YB-4239]
MLKLGFTKAQISTHLSKSQQIKSIVMPILQQTKPLSSLSARGETYKLQSQLPKLPVPELQETASKYIKTIEPFLNPQQLAASKAKVEEFIQPGGVGEELQQRLNAFAKGKDNWLAEFWDDYAYMSYRDPVVPFVSYFFSHKDVRNIIGEDQLLKATLIAYYTIEFAEKVQTEVLEPEVIKGNPFCMNAFKYMFNNSRVPAPGSDVTQHYDVDSNRFFIVIYKNNFYKVPTHNESGQRLSKGEIYSYLQQVKNDPSQQGIALGALTSLNRDEWLSAYQNLLKSPINEASLTDIFASTFVICLDENTPITIEEKSKNCWHGNGQNRWFDKPLEFFVSANGNSGFLGEHSRMDATPTVQMNNTILKQISETKPEELIAEIGSVAPKVGPADKLSFDINPTTRANIASAIVKFDETIAAHDEEIFQHYGYGKGLIKKFKCSPDAYVQMLMQLAYYKLTGKVRPTYESAATRKFLKGRTETGRTVSNESKKFVETWTDPNSSIEDKVATFQAATKQHVAYLSAAADGKGVDRHLFGLKSMLKPGEPVPEIFQDPIFAYSQTWYISSSQVPSEFFQSWGWSQVIDDGFGLAYLINNDWIHVHISCKRGNGLKSDQLKWFLVDSANQMQDVLVKGLLGDKAKL